MHWLFEDIVHLVLRFPKVDTFHYTMSNTHFQYHQKNAQEVVKLTVTVANTSFPKFSFFLEALDWQQILFSFKQ